MASNRIRSKRSVGTRMTRLDERVSVMERRPTPVRLAADAVTAENIAPGAVSDASIPDGSIENIKLSLPWASYTSALTGTGWAIGDGTITAKYVAIGQTVHFRVVVASGSSTTYGSASPIIALPLAGVSTNALAMVCTFYDSSVTTTYLGVPTVASTTTITCNAIGASGVQTVVTSTVPFTWATGDEIRLAGTYEIP